MSEEPSSVADAFSEMFWELMQQVDETLDELGFENPTHMPSEGTRRGVLRAVQNAGLAEDFARHEELLASLGALKPKLISEETAELLNPLMAQYLAMVEMNPGVHEVFVEFATSGFDANNELERIAAFFRSQFLLTNFTPLEKQWQVPVRWAMRLVRDVFPQRHPYEFDVALQYLNGLKTRELERVDKELEWAENVLKFFHGLNVGLSRYSTHGELCALLMYTQTCENGIEFENELPKALKLNPPHVRNPSVAEILQSVPREPGDDYARSYRGQTFGHDHWFQESLQGISRYLHLLLDTGYDSPFTLGLGISDGIGVVARTGPTHAIELTIVSPKTFVSDESKEFTRWAAEQRSWNDGGNLDGLLGGLVAAYWLLTDLRMGIDDGYLQSRAPWLDVNSWFADLLLDHLELALSRVKESPSKDELGLLLAGGTLIKTAGVLTGIPGTEEGKRRNDDLMRRIVEWYVQQHPAK